METVKSDLIERKSTFRWRVIPAALNWAFGGIVLSAISLVLMFRGKELWNQAAADGGRSLILPILFTLIAAVMIVSGMKWEGGRWTAAVLWDIVAFSLLMVSDRYEASSRQQQQHMWARGYLTSRGGNAVQSIPRRTYEESCIVLQIMGVLEPHEQPPIPDHPPRSDDPEPLGVEFFDTSFRECDFMSLTLPRTYMGQAEFIDVSFLNTDLSESTMCWNDFVHVDFSEADLSRADLRASRFERVSFLHTDLSGADLRRSEFIECVFDAAIMTGARLTRSQAGVYPFSPKQVREIDWQDNEGDVPEGG